VLLDADNIIFTTIVDLLLNLVLGYLLLVPILVRSPILNLLKLLFVVWVGTALVAMIPVREVCPREGNLKEGDGMV